MVERQFQQVQRNHDQVKMLRDQFRARAVGQARPGPAGPPVAARRRHDSRMVDERAPSTASDALKTYRAKRRFEATPEPAEGGAANEDERAFVVQKHWATRLHYDFRLELEGTHEELGGAQGPELRPGRQAHGDADRGPSDRLQPLRGHHPQGQLRRRQGDRLGQGHLAPAGGPAQGLARRAS